VDLVIVAVPTGADAATTAAFSTSYSWVLNWSLSFAHQQWEEIGVPPSTVLATFSRSVHSLLKRRLLVRPVWVPLLKVDVDPRGVTDGLSLHVPGGTVRFVRRGQGHPDVKPKKD
jgi:hypothetical protein